MSALPEGAYAAALASLPGVGPRTLRTWLDDAGPAAVWRLLCDGGLDPRFAAAARRTDVAGGWEAHRRRGIDVLVRGRPPYPSVLAPDGEAPASRLSAL